MSDLISREYMKSLGTTCIASRSKDGTLFPIAAIDELPPADLTHETPPNTLDISVCVDKQAVIDQITRLINEKHHIKIGTSTFRDGVIDGYARVLSMVKRLPSVQPDVPDTNVGELISRQAAIDAISKKQGGVFEQDAEIDTAILYAYSECKAIIKHLPSVQPSPCEFCKHNDVAADGICLRCMAELRGDSDDR